MDFPSNNWPEKTPCAPGGTWKCIKCDKWFCFCEDSIRFYGQDASVKEYQEGINNLTTDEILPAKTPSRPSNGMIEDSSRCNEKILCSPDGTGKCIKCNRWFCFCEESILFHKQKKLVSHYQDNVIDIIDLTADETMPADTPTPPSNGLMKTNSGSSKAIMDIANESKNDDTVISQGPISQSIQTSSESSQTSIGANSRHNEDNMDVANESGNDETVLSHSSISPGIQTSSESSQTSIGTNSRHNQDSMDVGDESGNDETVLSHASISPSIQTSLESTQTTIGTNSRHNEDTMDVASDSENDEKVLPHASISPSIQNSSETGQSSIGANSGHSEDFMDFENESANDGTAFPRALTCPSIQTSSRSSRSAIGANSECSEHNSDDANESGSDDTDDAMTSPNIPSPPETHQSLTGSNSRWEEDNLDDANESGNEDIDEAMTPTNSPSSPETHQSQTGSSWTNDNDSNMDDENEAEDTIYTNSPPPSYVSLMGNNVRLHERIRSETPPPSYQSAMGINSRSLERNVDVINHVVDLTPEVKPTNIGGSSSTAHETETRANPNFGERNVYRVIEDRKFVFELNNEERLLVSRLPPSASRETQMRNVPERNIDVINEVVDLTLDVTPPNSGSRSPTAHEIEIHANPRFGERNVYRVIQDRKFVVELNDEETLRFTRLSPSTSRETQMRTVPERSLLIRNIDATNEDRNDAVGWNDEWTKFRESFVLPRAPASSSEDENNISDLPNDERPPIGRLSPSTIHDTEMRALFDFRESLNSILRRSTEEAFGAARRVLAARSARIRMRETPYVRRQTRPLSIPPTTEEVIDLVTPSP